MSCVAYFHKIINIQLIYFNLFYNTFDKSIIQQHIIYRSNIHF